MCLDPRGSDVCGGGCGGAACGDLVVVMAGGGRACECQRYCVSVRGHQFSHGEKSVPAGDNMRGRVFS